MASLIIIILAFQNDFLTESSGFSKALIILGHRGSSLGFNTQRRVAITDPHQNGMRTSQKGKLPSLNVQAGSLPSAGEAVEGNPALKRDSKLGFVGLT